MGNVFLFLTLGLLVFVVMGAFFYGLYVLLNPTRTAKDRLRDLGGPEEVEAFDIISVDNQEEPQGMAGRLGQLAAPTSEEEKSKQRQLLMQAGFKNRHALEIYNSVRVTMALSMPILASSIPIALGWTFSINLAFIVVAAATVGYYFPAFWLKNVTDKRKRRLLSAFPDALDLLVSCVEAGLGLDAAFRRVSLEMETASAELAREFQLVTHEISAGVPRVDALRHLETRTGLDEIRSLVNMLAQAERFGTSIAKGLRVHSRMTRAKRMSRAEEEAAKVSPKLTVVMILFLLPVLGAVLVGPAAIKVYEVMSQR